MNIANIVEMLEENRLSEITELLVDEEKCVLEFFYDFDIHPLIRKKLFFNVSF